MFPQSCSLLARSSTAGSGTRAAAACGKVTAHPAAPCGATAPPRAGSDGVGVMEAMTFCSVFEH